MLIEKLISIFIAALAITALSGLLMKTVQIKGGIERKTHHTAGGIKLSMGLDNTCFQHNTITYSQNTALSCIYSGTCQDGQSGKVSLVDGNANILNDIQNPLSILYDDNLLPCINCSTSQSAYYLDVDYTISCKSPCVSPMVTFDAKYKSIRTGNTSSIGGSSSTSIKRIIFPEKVYLSCQDAFNKGNYSSFTYYIDFDGYGGSCPIKMYCDMSSSDKKMLLINAPSIGYTKVPDIAPPVTPNVLGKLNDVTIEYILSNVSSSSKLISVDVIQAQYPLVAYTVGLDSSVDRKGSVTADVTVCTNGNTQYTSATSNLQGPYWEFASSNGTSSLGYSENIYHSPIGSINVTTTTKGFHCIIPSTSLSNLCGLAPGTCSQFQLEGAVWLKY